MARVYQKDGFYVRTVVLTVFLLLVFLTIVARLVQLQIVQGAETRELAESQRSFFQKLLPSRGEIKITDKFSGQVLPVATNKKNFLVYAVPREIQNPSVTAAILAAILSVDIKEIETKFTWQDKLYVPLKKQLTEEEQQKIKELKLAGIYFDSEEARYYPEKNLLSHVLGFVGYKDDKRVGLYGLERYFEKELAGQEGHVAEEKGIGGARIFGARRDFTPALHGTNFILTIDKTIQFKAESVLKATVEQHQADGGSVVVVNPKTGAVLAMANFPDFNPNEYNKVEDLSVYTNESTIGNYEPGSIFKPLTMAAAINEGKITPETTYTDTGSVVIDGYTIKNSDNKAHGEQTMSYALEQSLNTGVIFAKDQIGNAEFYNYVRKFGFGRSTGIELPEAKGNLDNLKANIKVNYHTASFGQGISVTPIQMVQAFTALANGGKMMKPYIVQSVILPDGETKNIEPQVAEEVVTAKTANIVSAMLVNVIESGHGKKAAVPGYYLGGKTGTAQVSRKDGRGYESDNNIGSFIGYGPIENPQFLMLVRINHPRTVQYAESTAAPAWGELAAFILNYYQIPPTREVVR